MKTCEQAVIGIIIAIVVETKMYVEMGKIQIIPILNDEINFF